MASPVLDHARRSVEPQPAPASSIELQLVPARRRARTRAGLASPQATRPAPPAASATWTGPTAQAVPSSMRTGADQARPSRSAAQAVPGQGNGSFAKLVAAPAAQVAGAPPAPPALPPAAVEPANPAAPPPPILPPWAPWPP